MLGRAVNTYENKSARDKDDATKPAVGSQNGNIQDQFAKPSRPSQSIGAFTNYTNSSTASTVPLTSQSSNFTRHVDCPLLSCTLSETELGNCMQLHVRASIAKQEG